MEQNERGLAHKLTTVLCVKIERCMHPISLPLRVLTIEWGADIVLQFQDLEPTKNCSVASLGKKNRAEYGVFTA